MSLSDRLSSLSDRGGGTEQRRDSDGSDYSATAAERQLVQRCVIIQKDERGYGLTVSGDNPVYVASVKPEGAAAKAGVQKDDRIVKVNGTLVLNRNHIDVVKLIRSGSYVALTLMGKPNLNEGGQQQHPVSPHSTDGTNAPSNRNSRITAPQPVDPDKDRELLHQKVHMTRVMLEQAREDFLKQQKQYVRTPSEKLHTQLLDKERTVKTLENQLRALTGGEEPTTQVPQKCSDLDQNSTDSAMNSWATMGPPRHVKQVSLPAPQPSTYSDTADGDRQSAGIMRSKSDAAMRRSKGAATQSTFYVGLTAGGATEALVQGGGKLLRHKLKRWKSSCSSVSNRPWDSSLMHTLQVPQATSLPVSSSDTGSKSDSPHHSPCVSPTPLHSHNACQDTDDLRAETAMEQDSGIGHSESTSIASTQQEIIIVDDEDVNSDDEPSQTMDTGPFSDIRVLDTKAAHSAVFLHYLISNSDPCALLFFKVTDMYKQTAGNTKDLRKWGYEIFSTFLVPTAPLRVEVNESLVARVSELLSAGSSRTDNELLIRGMFDGCRAAVCPELSEQLAEFRNMRAMGLGSIFGTHELLEDMDKSTELKMIEKYLIPHLKYYSEDSSNRKLSERDLAMGWALATFLRHVGLNKTSSGGILERVQSFMMKDKRSFKLGSRSAKAKGVKGHQFNLHHFYVPTLCTKCESLIWGVGYQGFLCQSCEIGVHKQCVEDITEVCSGKKRSKRSVPFVPRPRSSIQPPVVDAGGHVTSPGETRSPPHPSTEVTSGVISTQPLKEEDVELAHLGTEVSVKSIVKTWDLASPTEPGAAEETTGGDGRKGSTDLNRSESWKGKGDKSDRPARRAKSDVDRDDMFHAISIQSGSSSDSSLSKRSGESPSQSSEHVNESVSARTHQRDPDLEVEELPPLKRVLGDEVSRLKPKEKKRQEVINELFHTEKAHLRNLKVLDLLFNHPMQKETGVIPDLARALFPNMEEMITLHASMNQAMKDRRSQNPVVGDVGDILLDRFDGEQGDRFRKACAEYCRNQSFTLERLKHYRRKDQRLAQFLAETEADPLCRKLELKDHVPCQMQRLTKYPMLIENLLKYAKSTSSQEYKNLERALERSKHILAYVNQAVRECQNYHKLKDMQKKLETRAIDASADPSLLGIKNLDLTQHKLVFEGPLVWRLRSRLIDLQVVLLEDILVLLQRVDDKLVLKCQSTNLQAISNDFKYTHSPVLKLQNLLARDVATDKKAFFVINTSDTGPQIYELVAQTQEARKTWCKLINEHAGEQKKTLSKGSPRKVQRVQESPTDPDEMFRVRERIMGSSQASSPSQTEEAPAIASAAPSSSNHDRVDNLRSVTTAEFQPPMVQPDQVSVSGAVTAEAQPVLTPIERLRRNDQVLAQALSEKEAIVAEILQISPSDYRRLAQVAVDEVPTGTDDNEQSLIVLCIDSNNRLIQLLSSQASTFAQSAQQPSAESGSGTGSESGSNVHSASVSSDSDSAGSSQLRQYQAQLAQGAVGQSVNVPMPMNQLQVMAMEMNKILSTLMKVLEVKDEERHTLRSQLEAAQKQLDMLKMVQQQILAQQPPAASSDMQSRPPSFVSVTSSVSEAGEVITDSEHAEDDTTSVLNVAHTQELHQEMVEETAEETLAHLQPQMATGPAPSAPGGPSEEDSDEDPYPMIPENLPLPDDNCLAQSAPFPGVTEGGERGAGEKEGSTDRIVEEGEKPMPSEVVDDGEKVMDRSMEGEEGLTSRGTEEGEREPMTTDLDEGGDDMHTTPTPSPTSPEPAGGEDEEDRDSVATIEEDVEEEAFQNQEETTATVKEDKDSVAVFEEVGESTPPGGQGPQLSGDQIMADESRDKAAAADVNNGENNNRTSQESELTNPIEI